MRRAGLGLSAVALIVLCGHEAYIMLLHGHLGGSWNAWFELPQATLRVPMYAELGGFSALALGAVLFAVGADRENRLVAGAAAVVVTFWVGGLWWRTSLTHDMGEPSGFAEFMLRWGLMIAAILSLTLLYGAFARVRNRDFGVGQWARLGLVPGCLVAGVLMWRIVMPEPGSSADLPDMRLAWILSAALSLVVYIVLLEAIMRASEGPDDSHRFLGGSVLRLEVAIVLNVATGLALGWFVYRAVRERDLELIQDVSLTVQLLGVAIAAIALSGIAGVALSRLAGLARGMLSAASGFALLALVGNALVVHHTLRRMNEGAWNYDEGQYWPLLVSVAGLTTTVLLLFGLRQVARNFERDDIDRLFRNALRLMPFIVGGAFAAGLSSVSRDLAFVVLIAGAGVLLFAIIFIADVIIGLGRLRRHCRSPDWDGGGLVDGGGGSEREGLYGGIEF